MIEVYIGIIAGLLGVTGFGYQSWKNPTGMTWPILIFSGISIGMWATYGVVLNNPILYVTNFIMVALLVYNAVMKFPKPIYPGLGSD